jgi:hypothetical protein
MIWYTGEFRELVIYFDDCTFSIEKNNTDYETVRKDTES